MRGEAPWRGVCERVQRAFGLHKAVAVIVVNYQVCKHVHMLTLWKEHRRDHVRQTCVLAMQS